MEGRVLTQLGYSAQTSELIEVGSMKEAWPENIFP